MVGIISTVPRGTIFSEIVVVLFHVDNACLMEQLI